MDCNFNQGDFMKNAIIALMLVFGFVSLTYAGDCSNGVCLAPVRKVVNITKNIVAAPVRVVGLTIGGIDLGVVPLRNSCDCCCQESTKTVTKYQPLRRRLVNRTTNVNCNCR
jgi:hypothetical protein